jgi:hypothetical protein
VFNFGHNRLHWKRLIYHDESAALKWYGETPDRFGATTADINAVFSAAEEICGEIGAGYRSATYKQALTVLLEEHGDVELNPVIRPRWKNTLMPEVRFPGLRFGSIFIAALSCNESMSATDLRRVQTAMQHLNLTTGLIIHFRRKISQIRMIGGLAPG